MTTFDALSQADIKEQISKLHELVSQYIQNIREAIEQGKQNGGGNKNTDIDKIICDLGDIKKRLIDILSDGKLSTKVMHAMNAVYNFEAFLNPIASAIVTYAIHILYINKIGLEIIDNVNNVIKCICMDMIARSKANRGIAEISSMSHDYDMKISEVISITQKYIDSQDTQVVQMMDQTMQRDADGFKENIESANELISAFSQNDKWVAEWGLTCKSIALQAANCTCLKIRKDMGSYIVALSTCLDKRVADNLTFYNDRDGYYNEDTIDRLSRENDNDANDSSHDMQDAVDDNDENISKGKDISKKNTFTKYTDFRDMNVEDKTCLMAYFKANPKDVPNCLRFYFDEKRLKVCLQRICEAIVQNAKNIFIGRAFYELMAIDDLRLTIYDVVGIKYSNSVEKVIKNRAELLKQDKRLSGAALSKDQKIEVFKSKNTLYNYYRILDSRR